MVSINNNFGIGALRATANAATANGLNDDTGKVKTLKASEQFPQPDVEKAEVWTFDSPEAWHNAGGIKIKDLQLGDKVIVQGHTYVVTGDADDTNRDNWYLDPVPNVNGKIS